MSSSQIITLPGVKSIESNLFRMKELSDSIKSLQAEYDMLKKEVIDGYFCNNDTFMTSKGLVLATYKEQIRTQFLTTEFKKAKPELYEQFCDLKSVKTFLLK
jgi:hypothetical protein